MMMMTVRWIQQQQQQRAIAAKTTAIGAVRRLDNSRSIRVLVAQRQRHSCNDIHSKAAGPFTAASASTTTLTTTLGHFRSLSFTTAAAPAYNDALYFHQQKQQLLQKSLECVIQYGWTMDAIAAAAATTSSTTSSSFAIIGLVTVEDLIFYAMNQWNERLRTDIRNEILAVHQRNEQEKLSAATTKSNKEWIAWSIRKRLSYIEDYVRANRWHEGMACGIQNPNTIDKTRQQIVNIIHIIVTECSDCSDGATSDVLTTSSSLQHWSLGAIYVAAELHMLSDTSTDFMDTTMFVHSQVEHWDRVFHMLPSETTLLPPNAVANVWNTFSSLLPLPPPWSISSTTGMNRNATSSPPFLSSMSPLQYHTPSDIMWTASVLRSAFMSGAMSLAAAPPRKQATNSQQGSPLNKQEYNSSTTGTETPKT